MTGSNFAISKSSRSPASGASRTHASATSGKNVARFARGAGARNERRGAAETLRRGAVAMASRFDATGRSLSSELAEAHQRIHKANEEWLAMIKERTAERDAALAKVQTAMG